MGVFRWLKRKLYTGDVIRDYGVLGEVTGIAGPGQVSLLLCRRAGQLQLVICTRCPFNFNWYPRDRID